MHCLALEWQLLLDLAATAQWPWPEHSQHLLASHAVADYGRGGYGGGYGGGETLHDSFRLPGCQALLLSS